MIYLRERNTHINLRTTPQEKAIISRNSKKCGLTTSEYLRKLATGYAPKALPPVDFFTLIEAINDIYRELETRYTPELEQKLLRTILQLQAELLIPDKRGDDGGCNADMAGEGQS